MRKRESEVEEVICFNSEKDIAIKAKQKATSKLVAFCLAKSLSYYRLIVTV